MKKVIFMATIAVCSYCTASAQNTAFGIKAGLSGANYKFSDGDQVTTYDTRLGFYAGVLAEIGVCENFAVQPELFYAQMGHKQDFSNNYGGTYEDVLGYINLPVLLKYKNQGFSAYVGPQVGYLLSAKLMAQGESIDQKDEYKPIDFSGVIGAGYTLKNGFGIDARYQLGLVNVAKYADEEVSLKNYGFQVGAHYIFNIQ